MTTIKVKLRSSTVKDKLGTIYYQIICRRKMQQITTDVKLIEDERNAGKLQIYSAGSDYSMLQDRTNGNVYMLSYMRTQIEQLKNANRIGTAQNYERALNSFSAFLNDIDIPFTAVTGMLIDSYNAYLQQRGIVRNSISFYMRILRAVYNKAVRQHFAKQIYPFLYVYTGIDKTRKRAVEEQVIVNLYKLELPEHSSLTLAKDIFLFSYFTRGMAFVDIAYLKRADIQNGMICYTRRKTGQKLSIRIEPVIKQIIEKYKNFKIPYVFPIIKSEMPHKAYEQYKSGINNYNRRLKSLSKMLPGNVKLTSYVARHSWATAARNHNIPVSVISAGLGHSSEQTTRIYLTMLENSVIDMANRKIISAIKK